MWVGMWGPKWLYSSRLWVAGAAGADLLARLPTEIIVPFVSIAGGWSGVGVVSTVTTWTLVVVVVYVFTPLVYSTSEVLPRRARGFRAIVAGGALVVGIGIGRIQGDDFLEGLAFTLAGWLLATGVMLWYLSRLQGWALQHPWGRPGSVLETMGPQEKIAELGRETFAQDGESGTRRTIARALWPLATGLVVTFPIALCGALSVTLERAFPFPDLLILTWVVVSSVPINVGWNTESALATALRFEVDRFLHDAMENASRGFQGACSTIMIVTGLLVPAGLLSFTPVVAIPLLEISGRLPVAIDHPRVLGVVAVGTWTMLGLVLLMLSTALLTLWGWIREFQRLPAFLDQWENGPQEGTPPRVPGVTLVPSLTFLVGGVSLGPLLSEPTPPTDMVPFALVWPALVAIQVQTVRYTRQRSETPLAWENHWIAASVTVQFLAVWGVGLVDPDVSLPTVAPQIGTMVLLFLVLATYPSVERAERDADRSPLYSVGYALSVSGALLYLSTLLGGDVGAAVVGLAVVVGGPAVGWLAWQLVSRATGVPGA